MSSRDPLSFPYPAFVRHWSKPSRSIDADDSGAHARRRKLDDSLANRVGDLHQARAMKRAHFRAIFGAGENAPWATLREAEVCRVVSIERHELRLVFHDAMTPRRLTARLDAAVANAATEAIERSHGLRKQKNSDADNVRASTARGGPPAPRGGESLSFATTVTRSRVKCALVAAMARPPEASITESAMLTWEVPGDFHAPQKREAHGHLGVFRGSSNEADDALALEDAHEVEIDDRARRKGEICAREPNAADVKPLVRGHARLRRPTATAQSAVRPRRLEWSGASRWSAT